MVKTKQITLSNGLKAILTSDLNTDVAAMACNVNVGYYQDPDETKGLAHFLEHMLFMGSKKYPGENHYSVFLQDHGGSSNAYTAEEDTNYYFDILAEHLEPAADIFARFFIDPLFTESSVEREMQAVESEFQKNLQSDAWRQDQLLRGLNTHTTHPYTKFGIGNMQTLKKETIREELIAFHQRYYSADRMTVVVYGKESLADLEAMVQTKFSEVKNNPYTLDVPEPFSFQPSLHYIMPVKEARELELMWMLPSMEQHYLAKPINFLAYLIKREGEGSLYTYLQKLDLITDMTCGGMDEGGGVYSFAIGCYLTPHGLENIQQIMGLVFKYLDMLCQKLPENGEQIFQDLQKIKQLDFKYRDQLDPVDYVSYYSHEARHYPEEHLFEGPYLYTNYQLDLYLDLLQNHLTPDKMKVFVNSQTTHDSPKLVEPWYQTTYWTAEIPNIPQPNKLFLFPTPNPYVTNNTTLITGEEQTINLLGMPFCEIWHKPDYKYKQPRIQFIMQIVNPLFCETAQNRVLTSLYLDLLSDSLDTQLYEARKAGASYKLGQDDTHLLTIEFDTYQDQLPSLINQVLEQTVNLTINPTRFEALKSEMEMSLTNTQKNSPYKQVHMYLNYQLYQKIWKFWERLEAIKQVQLDDLVNYQQQMFESVFVKCLLQGNLHDDLALNMVKQAMSYFPSGEEYHDHRSPINQELSDQTIELSNPEETNHAITMYYHLGDKPDLHTIALMILLSHILEEPFFDQLRTQEQLGYIVRAGTKKTYNTYGLTFTIQSAIMTPDKMAQRIEQFIQTEWTNIQAMTDDDFETHVETNIGLLLERDVRLSQEVSRNMAEIVSDRYSFQRREDVAEEMESLDIDELKDFYQEYLLNGNKTTISMIAPTMA